MKKYALTLCWLIAGFYTSAQDAKTVIESFSQGPGKARNCASISVIKAAIANHGISGVFNKVDEATDRYKITLKNGESLELLKSEETIVNGYDKFELKGNEQVYKAARFMYAVMAKRKMIRDGESGIKNVLKHRVGIYFGLYFLETNTDANVLLLGLEKNYTVLGNLSGIDALSNIIIACNKHSVYSNKGVFDEYGTTKDNNLFKNLHQSINYACSFH